MKLTMTVSGAKELGFGSLLDLRKSDFPRVIGGQESWGTLFSTEIRKDFLENGKAVTLEEELIVIRYTIRQEKFDSFKKLSFIEKARILETSVKKKTKFKTWLDPFSQILNGNKTCEFRNFEEGERVLEVGDLITLCEWVPGSKYGKMSQSPEAGFTVCKDGGYTGREIRDLKITHIIDCEKWHKGSKGCFILCFKDAKLSQ